MTVRGSLRLGGAIGLVAGLVLALSGGRTAIEAHATGRWPHTDGRIESCRVEKTSKRRGAQRSVSYRPRVEYTYEVAGRPYRSQRISLGDAGIGLRAAAESIASRYPEGSTVQVAYDPGDPGESVLVTGLTIGSAGLLLLGLGVASVSLVLIASPRWLPLISDGKTSLARMPDSLWEGGEHHMELVASLSHDGSLFATFSREIWNDSSEEWEIVGETTVEQDLPAGDHRFALRIPGEVSAQLEIELDDPPPGAWIHGGARVDGRSIWREEARLDEPLDPGYAFSLEAEFDDLSAGR